jgi:hypothetical protein
MVVEKAKIENMNVIRYLHEKTSKKKWDEEACVEAIQTGRILVNKTKSGAITAYLKVKRGVGYAKIMEIEVDPVFDFGYSVNQLITTLQTKVSVIIADTENHRQFFVENGFGKEQVNGDTLLVHRNGDIKNGKASF